MSLRRSGVAGPGYVHEHPFRGKAARAFARLGLREQRQILQSLPRFQGEGEVLHRFTGVMHVDCVELRRLVLQSWHADGSVRVTELPIDTAVAGDVVIELVIRRSK